MDGIATQANFISVGDPDVIDYIARVQEADGEALEAGVKQAYEDFIVGCKSDGIWEAIKASCIMCGARTLEGALTPLKGPAPTNVDDNFVAADYNRFAGLKGDASTKYLNSNRRNNDDPQNSNHNAVYATEISSVNGPFMSASGTPVDNGTNYLGGSQTNNVFTRNRSSTGTTEGVLPSPGFFGHSRSASASYQVRRNKSSNTVEVASQTSEDAFVFLFRRVVIPFDYTNHRISFYSIGEALDLEDLDNRLETLMNDLDDVLS